MSLINRLPSLQSLLVFATAARLLSFTAAARELNSSQSAVSQLIRQLEQQIELTLFKRIYRGVELTEEGEALYSVVDLGLNQIAKCIEKLQTNQRPPCINVVTDFAFAAYWLLPKLPHFREQHPHIDVRIITSQGESKNQQQPLNPQTDIQILFCPQPPTDAHLLFSEEVFPIISPAFLKQQGSVNSHKTLANLPLLKLETDAGQEWIDWLRFFQERRSSLQPSDPVMTFNNYTLLVQAVIAGQGVGIGWATLVDELIDNGLLVALKGFSLQSKGGYFVMGAEQPQKWLSSKDTGATDNRRKNNSALLDKEKIDDYKTQDGKAIFLQWLLHQT